MVIGSAVANGLTNYARRVTPIGQNEIVQRWRPGHDGPDPSGGLHCRNGDSAVLGFQEVGTNVFRVDVASTATRTRAKWTHVGGGVRSRLSRLMLLADRPSTRPTGTSGAEHEAMRVVARFSAQAVKKAHSS